jgi:hypothetical protein
MRLQRLYDRYNQRFWDGRLQKYSLRVDDTLEFMGLCNTTQRLILINPTKHPTDTGVRSTLLHEIAHAAAPGDGHGYKFWAEVERLLQQGAPISVGETEAPQLKLFIPQLIPPQFVLSRKAVGRVAAATTRKEERKARGEGLPTQAITEEDILGDFRNAASDGLTWNQARRAVGNAHGLLDVGGKPSSPWAAKMLQEARRAHALSKRPKRGYGRYGLCCR